VRRLTAEARLVAGRIRQLLDTGFPVTQGDGSLRPCRCEDIVILMRSPSSRNEAYAQALAEQNIPCSFDAADDFFSTMEISVLLSLLQIIDNPRQDVPLISALRSPLFGFTPDRLAQIRGRTPQGDFYTAVEQDGGEDCRAFLAQLQELRAFSRDNGADRLLWHIYDRLNVLGVFGAMDGGDRRRENLIALSAHAEAFESSGYRGLFAFVTQLRRLLESGQAPATRGASGGGGVRLMSIHKSKGLEFPIVFLTDLDRAFSRQDFDSPVLVHPPWAWGPAGWIWSGASAIPPWPAGPWEDTLRRENKAEEQRILYVAMTRAREKLILVDSSITPRHGLGGWFLWPPGRQSRRRWKAARASATGCCWRCCAGRRPRRCGSWRAWRRGSCTPAPTRPGRCSSTRAPRAPRLRNPGPSRRSAPGRPPPSTRRCWSSPTPTSARRSCPPS
jgi:ATP-dependent helicase/nuclease subunit A